LVTAAVMLLALTLICVTLRKHCRSRPTFACSCLP